MDNLLVLSEAHVGYGDMMYTVATVEPGFRTSEDADARVDELNNSLEELTKPLAESVKIDECWVVINRLRCFDHQKDAEQYKRELQTGHYITEEQFRRRLASPRNLANIATREGWFRKMPTDVDVFNMLRDNVLETLTLEQLRNEITRARIMSERVVEYTSKIVQQIELREKDQ